MAMLTGALRARIRRATMRAPDAEPAGELNITPFLDVVVNLVLFLLATSAAVLSTTEVEARLPDYVDRGTHGTGHGDGLRLSVFLTERGVVVTDRDGTLGPGCAALGGPGALAVAPADGALDRAALERCAALLHARAPAERTVILGADPTIPYADVLAAMDALRGTGPTPLFTEVLLSAGVR